MTDEPDPLLCLVRSSANALGLSLEPDWLPTVCANLEVSLRLAKLVDEFPLPDDHEPADIYTT